MDEAVEEEISEECNITWSLDSVNLIRQQPPNGDLEYPGYWRIGTPHQMCLKGKRLYVYIRTYMYEYIYIYFFI